LSQFDLRAAAVEIVFFPVDLEVDISGEVVGQETHTDLQMIGFILPNEGNHEPLATFAVTVDAVEKATGLNFFSRVPKEEQERLERTISVKAWKGL